MNRKFAVSAVVMFVLAMLFGWLVHGMILHSEYAKLPNLMRPESQAMGMFGFIVLANVLFALGFTWIYLKGREAKPWLAQGARFGLAVAVMATIPTYLIYYAVMPFPSDMVAQQIVLDTIATVIMGVVLAWLNR